MSGYEPNAGISTEAKDRKPVAEMSPSELRAFRKTQEQGRRWNRQNPVHPDNVIAHWNSATESEKNSGMDWYHDAHEMTKHIAKDTGHSMDTAAGLMSTYSPQTHWATNMMNAAKAMRLHKGIGGPGSGIMATKQQKSAASRLMGTDGHEQEHYEQVLKGPKTKAFARLIHHGGNANPDKPDVVIDRHALSVAAGARATNSAYEQSGLGGVKRYREVADVYHKAAQHISKHTGVPVAAHQVQAATWLVRQRLNSGEDARTASTAKRGRDATEEWNAYSGEHHPLVMGKEPGTGYGVPEDAPDDVQHSQTLHDEGTHGGEVMTRVPPTNPRRKPRLATRHEAYGETKAPMNVDTLREEHCPVCGESDAYDGDQCQVCGFITPPEMFRDPDLSKAKMLDLRADPASGAPNDTSGDLPPVDPTAIDAEGEVPGDEQDPNADGEEDGIVEGEVRGLGDAGEDPEAPVDPDQIDEEGNPVVDPEAATGHVNQGGEPFQPGPNAPTPEEPMEPGEQADDGQLVDGEQPEPGTPGDGMADLLCPSCGFEADAAHPTSTPNNTTEPANAGDGMLAGDLCPNCQKATLMSIGEVSEMQQQPMGI